MRDLYSGFPNAFIHQHDLPWNDGFLLWDVNSGYFLALEPVECGVKDTFINSNGSVESCGQFWIGEILVLQNHPVVQFLAAVHRMQWGIKRVS